MSTHVDPAPSGRIERCALAMCPPPERPWLRAMFAEASAVQGARQQLAWLAGAAGLLAAAVWEGASRDVPASVRTALAVAMTACGATAALAYRGVELLQFDDDVLIAASSMLALACAGLVLHAARRIFSPEAPA